MLLLYANDKMDFVLIGKRLMELSPSLWISIYPDPLLRRQLNNLPLYRQPTSCAGGWCTCIKTTHSVDSSLKINGIKNILLISRTIYILFTNRSAAVPNFYFIFISSTKLGKNRYDTISFRQLSPPCPPFLSRISHRVVIVQSFAYPIPHSSSRALSTGTCPAGPQRDGEKNIYSKSYRNNHLCSWQKYHESVASVHFGRTFALNLEEFTFLKRVRKKSVPESITPDRRYGPSSATDCSAANVSTR